MSGSREDLKGGMLLKSNLKGRCLRAQEITLRCVFPHIIKLGFFFFRSRSEPDDSWLGARRPLRLGPGNDGHDIRAPLRILNNRFSSRRIPISSHTMQGERKKKREKAPFCAFSLGEDGNNGLQRKQGSFPREVGHVDPSHVF